MRVSIRTTKKWAGCLLAVIVMSIAVFTLWPASAQAASGSVYSCTINRLYQHPVTGVIEDSGGAESYSIGQGMVEGCVYPNGILEVTDDGRYYLTIRMSLMDYTLGHTYWVQTWGEDGWSSPAAGITRTGTDSNGTTADICIQVPSEQCIVRGAMYVEPMGRDVYWYMYPGNFSEGNNTDMNATMVTSHSGSNQAAKQQEEGNSSQSSGNTQAPQSSSAGLSAGGSLSSGNTGLSSADGSTSSDSSSVKPSALQSSANTENTLSGLDSTIKEPAAPGSSETGDPNTESSIGAAQGLFLSTKGATEAGSASEVAAGATGTGTSGPILVNTLSIIIPGGILMAAAAIIVYIFRKKWKRWGGAPDDDE